jgi:FAD/FMN-containing dehydrogenase
LMHPKNKEQVKRVYQAGEAFMRKVVSMEGSITGEHGVGIEKRIYMPFMFNQAELDAMQQVKHIFDPSNLMNPGKIFPQTTSESHTQKIHIKELPGNCSPESIQEAAQCLAFCSRAHQPVLISGGSRKSQRIEENYSLISTSKLTGIHKYAPNDLYVVAGAGIVLDDLQAYLKEKGKWIPIISPWASATLGGVMAANVNSPLRMLYGSLSDQVLSMSVVLGDGRILRTGRPVVKNDAGYDLTKLFVGSFGTLGLIADITCKVISLPRCRRSVFMPVENINDGLRYGQKCLHLALKASAITLTKGITLPWLTTSDLQASHWLTYTAEGMPEDVETETQFVLQALQNEGASKSFILEDVSGSQLWQSLLGDPSVNKINIRTGVPAKTIGPILQLLGPSLESASYLIDFANGFIYTASEKNSLPVAMDWCENLRQSAQRFGGYSLLMEAPGEWFRTLDRLRFREDIFRLMQKLKASWDPAGILSPWVLNQAVG